MSRSNYSTDHIELPPGRYRVYGFPPMTGLLLDKWITIRESNTTGCYGEADLAIATTIPNIARGEDEHGRVVWRASSQ